jgi:predicted small integral membrane protein
MKAHAALAASLMYIRGAALPEVGAAWAKAFELAENLADTEFSASVALWLVGFSHKQWSAACGSTARPKVLHTVCEFVRTVC